MLTIYHSNRLDILKDILVAIVQAKPLVNPLADEQILVQSPGMAQWLRLQLAEGLGIAASVNFPLPASFLWDMYIRVLPDVPKRSAFNKEAMTWKIMALINELLDDEHFSALNSYLADDNDALKSYQLAGKIADIFDQYLVYRPDWIHDWEAGLDADAVTEHQQWQPILWRTLVERTAALQQSHWHRANMHEAFRNALSKTHCTLTLPDRLFVFGISAMPPHFVESLEALSQHVDIHLMIANPCRYYWGDAKDPKYQAKLIARQFIDYDSKGQRHSALIKGSIEHAENSNPLLGSMGKLGRDYLHQIHALAATDIDAFVDIPRDTLLHCIQHDILELQNSTTTEKPQPLAATDHSLAIHNCHSPLREVEVLHDQLLHLFTRHSDLTPKDIVVMLPDVDTFSPWIQAVFGSIPRNDPRYIPFSVSDRSARSEHPVLAGVLTLLDLDNSRCTAPELLQLLDIQALQQRFSINQEDLTTLRQWIHDAGIRWGINDEQLARQRLPPQASNTWLFGLKRMLLGYAMGEECGVYEGILPFEPVQGMAASLCGLLAGFIDQIEQLSLTLNQSRPINEWLIYIHALLDQFFSPDEEDTLALNTVREALEHLHEQLSDAEHQTPLSKAVLLSYLSERLTNDRNSQRFLAGQVNFCTLMPMRSIPFRVVCLLGMNDGAYPRTLAPAGFDLIAQHTRRGDRSRRDDDRYLFLEALLAAEQQLYISYSGRSIQDNTERAPSVLVIELLNYCSQGFVFEDTAEPAAKLLVTEHPLHAFSPDLFRPSHQKGRQALFSYAKEWLPAARRTGLQHTFASKPLPAITLPKHLELKDLINFYKNPCKFFLQRRLKAFFSENDDVQKDTEPFDLNALDKYSFDDTLLDTLIKGGPPEQLYELEAAHGHLPHKASGQLFMDEQLQKTTLLANHIRNWMQNTQKIEDLEINVSQGALPLTGWLTHHFQSGLLRYRPTTIKGKDILSAWVEHLCYCQAGMTGETQCIGLNKAKTKIDSLVFQTLPPQTARQYLNDLVTLYQEGLNRPIPLFPETAKAWLASGDEEEAQKSALETFYGKEGDMHTFSESNDAYIGRIFPELEPVFDEMTVLAQTVMGTALAHKA